MGRAILELVLMKVDFLLFDVDYSIVVNIVNALFIKIPKHCSFIFAILGIGSTVDAPGDWDYWWLDLWFFVTGDVSFGPIGKEYLSRGCEFKLLIRQFYQFYFGLKRYSVESSLVAIYVNDSWTFYYNFNFHLLNELNHFYTILKSLSLK